MVDKAVVEALVRELKNAVEYLRAKTGISEEDFLGNEDIEAAVERKLEIAMQSCIDIGSHVISQKGFSYPDSYRAVFSVLGRQKVIPVDLAGRLEKMAGFRNILVHEYVRVDAKEVYRILQTSLTDLDVYLKAIVASLDL